MRQTSKSLLLADLYRTRDMLEQGQCDSSDLEGWKRRVSERIQELEDSGIEAKGYVPSEREAA